jgi:predicted transcriptional regulator
MTDDKQEQLLALTADIVASHVANNNVSVSDIGSLIDNVHRSLTGLGSAFTAAPEERKPAVSVRSSVKPDHVICLNCGTKLKMLKRHLSTEHGQTPAEYRAHWNLPADYPIVAPNYAEARRAIAMKVGLGRKNGQPAPKRRGRGTAKS